MTIARTSPPRPDGAGQQPPADALAAATQALRALTLAAMEVRHAVADALGIAVTDTYALSCLAADGPVAPRDLARRLSIATSSVTTVVDRLERAGLAFRRPRAGDRRTHDVVLSERGARALQWAQGYTWAALETLGGTLGEATGTLDRIATALRLQAVALAGDRPAGDGFPGGGRG